MRILKTIVAFVILFSLMFGCAFKKSERTYGPQVPDIDETEQSGLKSSEMREIINNYRYDIFNAPGREIDGFGMYTYVLFGLKATDDDARERFAALLRAVGKFTMLDTLVIYHSHKLLYNIFYVPVIDTTKTKLSIDNYNYNLSKYILEWIKNQCPNDSILIDLKLNNIDLNGGGPFLISTNKSLKVLSGNRTQILIADLKTVHEDTFDNFIDDYKNYVKKKKIATAEFYRIPVKYRLYDYYERVARLLELSIKGSFPIYLIKITR